MRIDRALIGALLIGILALSPSAYGITITVGSNAGGFTENINAGDKDAVYSSTVIAANSLSHSIEGSGNLSESHSISNTAGATAEVGVDIRQADWYSYSYDLWPGQGSSWKASKFAQVAASEQLDVFNAERIEAHANAFNAKGYSAGVSTVVSDHGNEASLNGYRNLAMASKNEAFASQTAESAFSLDGYIQADSRADFMQLKSHPLSFREDTADASIRVDSGSVERYSDLASASAQGIWANQQMDAATGEQIRTRSESASWTASLFLGLKTANAKVTTTAAGNISGYNASARSSEGYAEADQSGHIVGTFTSTALAGKASKTRTSNYGNEYDFDMQARKDASGSYATGTMGYYVDNVSPVANRIQGAVDASESGDAVNVAPGTYFENVQIDKSLSVNGAGASDTIVDGQQAGSVLTIGKNNPNVDVALSGMTIQGGSGTPVEIVPGYLERYGGGIQNFGRMNLKDSTISGNTAFGGGGIFNYFGTVNMDGGSITGNTASSGGGIENWEGTVNMDEGSITGNTASYSGGGIFNYFGTVNMDRGSITGNTASGGGGIENREGTVNIDGGSITGNIADSYGGGIYSNIGTVNMDGGSITGNTAYEGGGIYNTFGTVNMDGGSITGNTAYKGGGIYNDYLIGISTVNLNNASSVSNNTAYEGGGIFNFGDVNLNGSYISSNNATYGGGIWNGGNLILNVSSIDHNTAEYGGGIYNEIGWVEVLGYYLFHRGIVNMDGGSIAGNTAHEGGGIENRGSIVNLDGGSITGNTAYEGGGIENWAGTVNMDGVSITGNNAYEGGGIENWDGTVNMDGGSIAGNTAYEGGGIYNDGYGTLNLNNNSSISNNTASNGGGIYNFGYVNLNGVSIISNAATYNGGGVWNGGNVTLNGSSIDHNTAEYGGGIYNAFGFLEDYEGSGVFSLYLGTVNLNRGSIDHNNATSPAPSGGGIYNLGMITGNTSIVHDNTPDQIASDVDWLPLI